MGNPSPGSKLKKNTTPSNTNHRHAFSSATVPSLDHLGKDVASAERTNGAGKSVASTASPGGGSVEKGVSPVAKDAKVRRRSRSSLGGAEDFVLAIDFSQGNPPAEEKKIAPTVEEKKHPFLLARGGLRNGVRSGSPSQPMQSPGLKQCTTSTPPGREKTALGRAGSTSVHSPRKLDMTSKKAEKELSLTDNPTAKRVQGDSVAVGQSKQNRNMKLQAMGKFGSSENSCSLLTSTDVFHPSKPDVEIRSMSKGLPSEVLTRPEIVMAVGLPDCSINELISKENDCVQNDQQQLSTLGTEEKSSAACTRVSPSLDYAQSEQLSLVPGISSETSFSQVEDNPTCLPAEEVSNAEESHKVIHCSDPGEYTSAPLISIVSPSHLIPGEHEGQVVTPDVEVRIQGTGCLPLEGVSEVENHREVELESADSADIKLALQTLQSLFLDLACEQQGWNEGDGYEPILSEVNQFSIYQAPDNVSNMQDKKVDLWIADTRRSATICAISPESASVSKLACAHDKALSTPDILEEFQVSPEKGIPTGFLSDDVLHPSDLSHTCINEVNLTEMDTSSDGFTANEQDELPSHTSLERGFFMLDVDKDHGTGKDLAEADSVLMVLSPDSVCHSAEHSGSVHDSNQELTAATMLEVLVHPSKDVESHRDVLDLMEAEFHAVETYSERAVYSPDGSQVNIPPECDQEMCENNLSTFHSGLSTECFGSKRDMPSEEIVVSPYPTQEIDIQAGTSAIAQQSELEIEEPPSVSDANQEQGAITVMTSLVFAIPPLDKSHAIYNVSPVPHPKEDKILEEVDCQKSANCISPKIQVVSEEGVMNIPNSVACTQEEGTNSVEEGKTASLIDALLDCPKVESRTSPNINQVSEEGFSDSGAGVEEVTQNLDNGSAACLREKASDCQKSENSTSAKLQSPQEVTNYFEDGAGAEEAADTVDEGSTACPLQDCPISIIFSSPEVQGVSHEEVANTCKNGACVEDTTDNVDAGSRLFFLKEPLVFQKSEDKSSSNIQEVSEEGVRNVPENYACAQEGAGSVEEWRTTCLFQEQLNFPECEKGSSPKIRVFPENGELQEEASDVVVVLQEPLDCQEFESISSPKVPEGTGEVLINTAESSHADKAPDIVDEGSSTFLLQEPLKSLKSEYLTENTSRITNIVEKDAFAQQATDKFDEGSTAFLLQETLDCPNSKNGTSPKFQAVTEDKVTNVPKNGACSEEMTGIVDEGSRGSLLHESLNASKYVNNTSPEIEGVSEQGVTNAPENDAHAEGFADREDDGSNLCIFQELENSPKSGNVNSTKIHQVSGEEASNPYENHALADKAIGSRTSLLQETGSNSCGILVLGIHEETGPAVQNDLMPADGGPVEKLLHAPGIGRDVTPMTESARPVNVDTQDEAKEVTLHQGIGGDQKASSTSAQHLPADEGSGDTDKKFENLELVAGHGVAPSPMKPLDTRAGIMAGSDAITEWEAGKSPGNTDGVLGSAPEDINEELKETLDTAEGPVVDTAEALEVHLLTEHNLGNLEEEKGPESGLSLNNIASSEGPLSLEDHVYNTADVAEKLVGCKKVSEGILDVSEDERVAVHILPEISTEPAAIGVPMGISWCADNATRREHPGHLGFGSCEIGEVAQKPETPIEISLDKQENDISEKFATGIPCILETPTAPMLEDEFEFCTEEAKLGAIVEKEFNTPAREVQIEDKPGNEENLNCLHELPTSVEAESSNMMASVGTADISEGLIPVSDLEVQEDGTSATEVNDQDSVTQGGTCNSTELFEKPAQSGGFEGANDIDEQGSGVAIGEATQLNSLLQTKHVLCKEESSSGQAEDTLLHENVGEIADRGASPDDKRRSAEADRRLNGSHGSVNLGAVTESVNFNNSNTPSQDDISCNGLQARKTDPVGKCAVLDGREPCIQSNHDDLDESERADTINKPLPLSGCRQQKDCSFEVSQALSTDFMKDDVQAPDQTEIQSDCNSEVRQKQTANQDQSSIAWKDMMANGQSKIMGSALEASAPETAKFQEPDPPLLPVLEQHPLSSSHQDHLQEEQTEVYAVGGRETPACLDEGATNAVQSLPPGAATTLDDQILPASGPVENTLPDAMTCPSTVDNGRTNEGKTGNGKARTPLRSLLAEDASKVSFSTGPGSPLKRLLSRLMGTKSGDKDIKPVKKKRPSTWNICLGDSAVQIGHKNHYS